MRNNYYNLNVPQAVAIGTPQNVRDLREKYVQIAGTFSATFTIEGTLNGSDYAPIQAGISAPGAWYSIPYPIQAVRVNVTSYVSGAPQVILAGFDANG